jgi:hypothetical protein
MTARPTFSARAMALPMPEPYAVHELLGQNVNVYDARQMREHTAAIAAEADALAEAARGLRVALQQARADLGAHYMMAPTTVGPALTRVDTALAAFAKAAGERAPKPPVAWIGPTNQLMPHEIFVAWREQYPDQGHEHFRPLVYGDAA